MRVATSRLDFVPVVSAALKELSSQHPDLHCTLVLGEEQELTGALACGSVDLALVSDHTAMSSVQYRDITLQPQSVDILDGTVEVSVWTKVRCISDSYGTTRIPPIYTEIDPPALRTTMTGVCYNRMV